MKQIAILGLAVVLLTAHTGCETIKGMGKDITNAGEALEDATR